MEGGFKTLTGPEAIYRRQDAVVFTQAFMDNRPADTLHANSVQMKARYSNRMRLY